MVPAENYKEFFDREGFLVLHRFFDAAFLEKAQSAIDHVKRIRPFDVVIDNLENGDRTVLGFMSAEAVKHDRMKINDLHLQLGAVRDLALSDKLMPVVQRLLGHVPALCNSLYLEKGSGQDRHVDSLYMTPSTPLHLIAAWIALEDAHEDAGQLEYFPQSHLIEPMVFSNGTYHFIEGEMVKWRAYMDENIDRMKLRRVTFSAKKGDVFIWHANLLHAGGVIRNPTLTRKSCVFHYFSEHDARMAGCCLVPQAGAFWIDRPPPPLPHRVAVQLPFNEQAYLGRYPDVANAVKIGQFSSGKAHYDLYGKDEGRLPC